MSENQKEIVEFLELPTSKLLEEFGKGSHIPGSGSAAALSSLIGIELLKTVCKLTQTKPAYSEHHSQMAYIQKELEEIYKPKIVQIFYDDSTEFGKASEFRILRDKENDQKLKRKYGRQAADQLKIATEIPIELCELNFKLIEYALSIFDNGYKATRGDAGVAISNFLSAISGTLFIVLLNIRVSQKSKWTEEKRIQAENLTSNYLKIQKDAFSRVLELYTEGLAEGQKAINFEEE
jgi:formiminotetrahydrofolate cyclodeaminase